MFANAVFDNFYMENLSPDMDFLVYEFDENNPVLTNHDDYYQLVLYTGGTGIHQIDFFAYQIQPATILAISKGQKQLVERGPGTAGYALCFTEQFIYRHEKDLEWLYSLCLFDVDKCDKKVTLSKSVLYNLLTVIKQIQIELGSPNDKLKWDIVRDLLRVFINRVEQLMEQADGTSSKNSYDYELYCSFRKNLDEYYKPCHTVAEYADKVHVTPKKLNQIALKYGGKHAKRIIEDRILLEIKRLLLYSSMTINEISLLTGFSDLTNFTRFFKRHLNTTPAKHRLDLQNGTF